MHQERKSISLRLIKCDVNLKNWICYCTCNYIEWVKPYHNVFKICKSRLTLLVLFVWYWTNRLENKSMSNIRIFRNPRKEDREVYGIHLARPPVCLPTCLFVIPRFCFAAASLGDWFLPYFTQITTSVSRCDACYDLWYRHICKAVRPCLYIMQ